MTESLHFIRYQAAGTVGVLTLNLPDKLNGLTGPMQAEIRHILAHLKDQQQVRALIVTGAGRAFSAGADLADILAKGDGRSQAEETYRAMIEQSNPLILELRASPIPIVAAVNGIAAGAGASLALAADIVVAGKSAGFLMPFIPRLGIVPDLGMTWMLPRMLGEARALALLLLGERISAEQAAAWGMIWSCVEDADLMTVAHELATRLGAAPRHATAELKASLRNAQDHTLEEQLRYEADRQRQLIARDEFQEGIAAFMAKRVPVFP
ncbi:enoyl-CoA hydratase-related protein [Pseudomonas sp. NFACC13-1]|uniref:enoyl-CoA hydratase-related protein n=1 Tax=Pseudomonas sp. NFACC13-1 TaxID=1566245 RepID=UPI00088205F1|nr:enoyl-CoA hydratase-related protein [Pseudomonas sp. NFACC13-1]SDB35142.1 2-(1,2-epoxy-1,2-dihydrophenyl)acetyl-CoA isomerase [Pseudomonas sp. NFACC13-1]